MDQPHQLNRVALVSGANRGIGRGIAEGLAAAGHRVFVGARSHADAGGHYDDGASARTLTDDDLLDAFQVNTIGPMRLIRATLPHLLEQGWGRIVNVSSRSGTCSANAT